MPNKSKMNGSTEDWSLLSWEMLVPKAKVLYNNAFGNVILLCIILGRF